MDKNWLTSATPGEWAIPSIVSVAQQISGSSQDFENRNPGLGRACFFFWWVQERYQRHDWGFWEFDLIVDCLRDYDQPFISINEKLFISKWAYLYWLLNDSLRAQYKILDSQKDQLSYLKWLLRWGADAGYPALPQENSRFDSLTSLDGVPVPCSFLPDLYLGLSNGESLLHKTSVCIFPADSGGQVRIPGSYLRILAEDVLVEGLRVPLVLCYLSEALSLGPISSDNFGFILDLMRIHHKAVSPTPEVLKLVKQCLGQPTYIKRVQDKGVTVMGFPYSEFGVGEDCRTTALAIKGTGLPTTIFELSSMGMSHPRKDLSASGLVSNFAYSGVVILNSPLNMIPSYFLKHGSYLTNENHVVGYCPWEFEDWPPNLNYCAKFVDEIWAPSEFLFQAYTKLGSVPVRHMPLAVTLPTFSAGSRTTFGLPSDVFLFGCIFDFNSGFHRKNPIATVRAFRAAFPVSRSDVGLVIKTMYRDSASKDWQNLISEIGGDARIHVIDGVYSRSDSLALLNQLDCYVSLHRSEGFGRIIAEAMLLGKPVIVTGYSGCMDFCNQNTALLVEFCKVPVQQGQYLFHEGMTWAEPSLESAVDQMRAVIKESSRVKQVVLQAKSLVESQHSLGACGMRYMERLGQLGFEESFLNIKSLGGENENRSL